MHRVVLDCDNTAGIPGRDIDNALALIFLSRSRSVDLGAVTTSFGNGSQEEVFRATEALLPRLGLGDIPLHRGAETPGAARSAASRYLKRILEGVDDAELLVTGSATNPASVLPPPEASAVARAAASEVVSTGTDRWAGPASPPGYARRRIVMMGGTLEPLIIGGAEMDELNISVDYRAFGVILESGHDLALVTGTLCLEHFWDRRRIERICGLLSASGLGWFCADVEAWAEWNGRRFGVYGFHPWDLIAAVYLTDPGIFRAEGRRISSDPAYLSVGRIVDDPAGYEIRLPVSLDARGFDDLVDEAFGG